MSDGIKSRISCYVEPEVKKYLDEQCKNYGVSQGAYLSMMLMQQKQNNESLAAMSKVYAVLEKIEEMEAKGQDINCFKDMQ